MYPTDQGDTMTVPNVPTLILSVSWVVSWPAELSIQTDSAVFYEFIFKVRSPFIRQVHADQTGHFAICTQKT